jgi:hypothetical protein
VHGCVTTPGYQSAQPFDAASDIAGGPLQSGKPAVAYCTEPQKNVALLNWSDGLNPPGAWSNWSCFDTLLHPRRIAATVLPSKSTEVYAVAENGLYVRRIVLAPQLNWWIWTGWIPMSLPTGALAADVADIATLGSPQSLTNQIALAVGPRIYRRDRVFSNGDTITYGPWSSILKLSTGRFIAVAIGSTSKGSPWQVAVAEGGDIISSGGNAQAPFKAVDIAAGYDAELRLSFYAVDQVGGLWVFPAEGDSPTWSQIKGGESPALTRIDVASTPTYAPYLFGVDVGGQTFLSLDQVSWKKWGTAAD